jgi:3-deoxy-D-manno-octulosonate 8-phosphate phosphatase KdsC-like HAD superfamily phosphatase
MSFCCEFQGYNNETNVSAVIFDLDGTLLDTGIYFLLYPLAFFNHHVCEVLFFF